MSAKALSRERSQRQSAAKAVGRWSTSARWEGCTKATASPRIRHILRDVEEQQGLYRAHSNELIDSSLTDTNFSFRLVEENGAIRKERITDVESVFAHMEESLEKVQRYRTVPEFRMVAEKDADGNKIPEVDDAGEPVLDKKGKPVYRRRKEPMPNAGARVPVAMRKDTIVAVEELFQLDPEWTGPIEGMTPDKRAEIQGLYDVWYSDLVEQYGAHNVLCISEHWDETSPHVSAFCMPLADREDFTAELNFKLFVTGKKDPTRTEARDAYAAKHDRLRGKLREHGYEATFERITPRDVKGFAAKGAPLANFKRAAKRATAEEREELAAEAERLTVRETQLVHDIDALVADARDRAAGIVNEAESVLDDARAEAERIKTAHMDWWKAEGRSEAEERVTKRLRTEMSGEISAAKAEARTIRSNATKDATQTTLRARQDAEKIKADAEARAEEIKTEARASARAVWERDEKPRLVEDALVELAGYKKSRRAEIDAELSGYEAEQRAKVPEYDPKTAVQAMQAARFEAGERRTIPIKLKDGSVRDIKANAVLDSDAKRIYARQGRALTDETVGQRSERLKKTLGKGAEDIGLGGEKGREQSREDRWR